MVRVLKKVLTNLYCSRVAKVLYIRLKIF